TCRHPPSRGSFAPLPARIPTGESAAEKVGQLVRSDRLRLTERGVLRIVTPDLPFHAVELGEERLDLARQRFGLCTVLPQVLIRLGAEAAAQGSPLLDQIDGDGAPGAAGEEAVEKAACPCPLAQGESRPVPAGLGLGGMPVHQEIDQQRIDTATGRQEGGSKIGAGKAGPQLFHPGDGRFGVLTSFLFAAERPLRLGERGKGFGLADRVAQGTAPRESLLQDGDRLLWTASKGESTPLKLERLQLDLPEAGRFEGGEGGSNLAQRGRGVALLKPDLAKAQSADRLQPCIAQGNGQLAGLLMVVERLLQISELARGGPEVVQHGDFRRPLSDLPVQLQGTFQGGERSARLTQAGVGGADVGKQSRLQRAVADARQDLPLFAVQAQRLLPLTQVAM